MITGVDISSKKFIKSFKEGSDKVADATVKAEEVEKEFVPYLQIVMDSNNIELIQEIINFFPKEFHIYSLVFLFQRIYEIKDKIEKSKKFKIHPVDVDDIKDSISKIFPKYQIVKVIEYNARHNMDVLVDIVVTSNDVRKIRTVCGYITPYYSSYKIYERLNELNKLQK